MSMFQKNFLTQFTDATRRGSEHCPYCGGYHSRDSEFAACARIHSSSAVYRCSRCGREYLTADQANACCEAEKRYERRYDNDRYQGYNQPEPSSFFGNSSSGSTDSSANGGFFDSFFNAGSKKAEENPKSGGFWPWE